MTRQQQWSKLAYDKVVSHKKRDSEQRYRSLALGLPSLVQQSGLCQAIAFVLGREGDVGATLVGDIADAVGQGGADELLRSAQTATLPQYLALTEKVLGAGSWFRRFADVELDGGQERNQDANAS